jgi:hypothetical protein
MTGANVNDAVKGRRLSCGAPAEVPATPELGPATPSTAVSATRRCGPRAGSRCGPTRGADGVFADVADVEDIVNISLAAEAEDADSFMS